MEDDYRGRRAYDTATDATQPKSARPGRRGAGNEPRFPSRREAVYNPHVTPWGTLAPIAEKVASGERLSRDEAVGLFTCEDVAALGRLADRVRRAKNGDAAYYVVNRHINYSNLCVDDCLFCAFKRKPGEAGGYTFPLAEIFRQAEDLVRLGAAELHIVGGHHPDLPFSYYEEMLRGLRARHPGVALKCFTAAEILHFAKTFDLAVEEILTRFKAAGLSMLPGGGAEVLSERVRRKLCRDAKGSAEAWLSVHRAAHALGIPSNATLLFGHVERPEDKAEHLLRVRDLQDETGGFLAFIPLAYHRENNNLGKLPEPTALERLRHIAVARLVLDNVPHIKAYWPMFGVRLTQVALSFGADDVDGTIVEERIYHMAGARTPQALSERALRDLIAEAGFRPVKRDAFYNALEPEEAPRAGGGAALSRVS